MPEIRSENGTAVEDRDAGRSYLSNTRRWIVWRWLFNGLIAIWLTCFSLSALVLVWELIGPDDILDIARWILQIATVIMGITGVALVTIAVSDAVVRFLRGLRWFKSSTD